jgi:hypothetical protein
MQCYVTSTLNVGTDLQIGNTVMRMNPSLENIGKQATDRDLYQRNFVWSGKAEAWAFTAAARGEFGTCNVEGRERRLEK